jgi:hypothetical protein
MLLYERCGPTTDKRSRPGIAFFLSSFYKRKELYFRVGIYVSAASMAGAFGGE